MCPSSKRNVKIDIKQSLKYLFAPGGAAFVPCNDAEHQTRSVVGGIIALDVGFSRLPQPPVMGYKVSELQHRGNGFCCFLARGAIRQ